MGLLSLIRGIKEAMERRVCAEAEYDRRTAGQTSLTEYYRRQDEHWREFAKQVATWRCSKCGGPITSYTHENDYDCAKCGWTNPVRPDGGVISSNGVCGSPQLVRPLLPELNA